MISTRFIAYIAIATLSLGTVAVASFNYSWYPLPPLAPNPLYAALTPHGDIWVTLKDSERLGRFKSGVYSEIDVRPSGHPYEIKAAGDDIYFSEQRVDIREGTPALPLIGHIDARGTFREIALPSAFIGVGGLAVGANGDVWVFDVENGNVGCIHADRLEFWIPSRPHYVAVSIALQGDIPWVIETALDHNHSSRVGYVRRDGVVDIALPDNLDAGDIQLANGQIWFTAGDDLLGHIPASRKLRQPRFQHIGQVSSFAGSDYGLCWMQMWKSSGACMLPLPGGAVQRHFTLSGPPPNNGSPPYGLAIFGRTVLFTSEVGRTVGSFSL